MDLANLIDFTDDEIFTEMRDMGYDIDRDGIGVLRELEKELMEAQKVAGDDILFEAVITRLNLLLNEKKTDHFLKDLEREINARTSTRPRTQVNANMIDRVESLLDGGYEVLNSLIQEINEYEKKILHLDSSEEDPTNWFGLRDLWNTAPDSSCQLSQTQIQTPQDIQASQQINIPSNLSNPNNQEQARPSSAEVEAVTPLSRAPSDLQNKGNHRNKNAPQRRIVPTLYSTRPRAKSPDVPNDWHCVAANESKLLDEFYKENALRPVVCTEPGRLPFRHDALSKYEQYKSQWERFGISNDPRRMSLRWHIRTLMCERDIPQLRLVVRDSLAINEKRNEWRP